jgi:hypothetical protein
LNKKEKQNPVNERIQNSPSKLVEDYNTGVVFLGPSNVVEGGKHLSYLLNYNQQI